MELYVHMYNMHICISKPPSTFAKEKFIDYTSNFCKYINKC